MKFSPRKSLTNLLTAGFSATGLLILGSPSVQAATTWLTTGTQDWATTSNWSGGAVPTSADVAFINTTAGSTYPIITTGAQAASEVWVGSFSGNPSRLDITGGSLAITSFFEIAPDATSNATLNQSGSSTITVAGTQVFLIGQSGGTGTYNLSGTASLTSAKTLNVGFNSTSTGNLNISGGTLTVNNSVNIGGRGQAGDGTPTGNVTMSGGTFTSTSWFSIGESGSGSTGTFNQTGGTVNAATSGGTAVNLGDRDGSSGTLNVSGGTFNSTGGGISVGNHWTGTGTGTGTINVSSTGVVNTGTATNGLKLGAALAASTGTVNLDGGTIQTAIIQKGPGTGTFNFNGGTLQATASTTTYMTGLTNAFVKSGGAVIDTNGFAITIGQALLTDPVSTGGGLSKSSTGTLTLSGANTYTGTTTINNGTLSLASTGSILSTTIKFNLTDSTAGQMTILNSGFSFGGTLSLGLAPVTASNSWTLFAGAQFDSSDLDSLSAVTSDLGSFSNAGGGTWSFSNGSGSWSFNDNTGTLGFTAVPEPGEYALAMASLLLILIGFRRHRLARE